MPRVSPPSQPIDSPVIEADFGDARNATIHPISSGCSTLPDRRDLHVVRFDLRSREPLLLRLFLVEFVDVWRLDDARMNRVDRDAERAELVGQRLGQVHDRHVAHAGQLLAAAARQAADIDDPAEAVAPHVGRGRLRATQVADHLDIDVLEQPLRVGVFQLRPHEAARMRGAVQQDVEPAEALDARGHRRFDGCHVGRVHRDGQDRSGRVAQRRERRANLGGGRFEVFHASRGDGDVDAFAGQLKRDRLADAHAAAGDERGFSVELQIHSDER